MGGSRKAVDLFLLPFLLPLEAKKGGEEDMAVILKQDVSGRRCWACGVGVEGIGEGKALIICAGTRDVIYLHPTCAQSLGQQLFRDLAQLGDLGLNIEEDDYFI